MLVRINFLKSKKRVRAFAGQSILTIALENNIHIL